MNRVRFSSTSFLLASVISSSWAMGQDPKVEVITPGHRAETEKVRAEADFQVAVDALNSQVASEAQPLILQDPALVKSEDPKSSDGQSKPMTRTYNVFTREGGTRTVTVLADILEANFGLSLAEADGTLRAQLEIPKDEGIVVVGVKAGSLADQAGLKRNDILLSLGDQKVKEVATARKILLGLGKEALQVKLIREGKPRTLSVVGPEHGFPTEVTSYWIGVPISPVDATLRAHLPSLPADSGLIANDVVKGSPADQVSLLKDDILVSIDGKPLKDSGSLIAQVQASQGKPVPLKILRAGKELTITITPAKRAQPAVLNLTSHPKALFKYQVVQPNLAIEVDPKGSQGQATTAQPAERRVELKNALNGQSIQLDPTQPKREVTVFQATPHPSQTTKEWMTFQLQNSNAASLTEASTARLETQMKDIVAKLDGITKALEGLKKAVEK